MLEGIGAAHQPRLNDLPLLTEQERHLVLTAWNQTSAAYPDNACIHQLFEAQVKRTPEAVAVVFENQTLTYVVSQTGQIGSRFQGPVSKKDLFLAFQKVLGARSGCGGSGTGPGAGPGYGGQQPDLHGD